MLLAPEVFSDVDIVDEIVDLLSAGTMTTQFSVQGALGHLCTNTESLARLRAEFDPFVEKAGSFEAAFKEDLTYDQLRDMNYVTQVFHESLRKNNVASSTGTYYFAEDTKIGWLTVKAHDLVVINIHGLHMNIKQW